MKDIKIKDVNLVSNVTGNEKIPVSNGSGKPVAVTINQILEYVITNIDSSTNEQIVIGTATNDNAMGSVTGAGTYNKGEKVTLTATANSGYEFVEWTDGVTDNPRVVYADVNGTIYTALFEESSSSPEQVFIGTATNDNAMGSVTGMGTFAKGTAITLEAIPNEGYYFVEWTDGETANPRVVTADINGTIYTAVFAKSEFE